MGILAKELKRKRGKMSLREAEAASGIHYCTLNRMERGIGTASWPNIHAALTWLDVPPWKWSEYVNQKGNGKRGAA